VDLRRAADAVAGGGADQAGGARARRGTARIRTLSPRRIDDEQGMSWPVAAQIERAEQGATCTDPLPGVPGTNRRSS
jgi:hypothetical protein